MQAAVIKALSKTDKKFDSGLDTILIGDSSKFDSLDFVMFFSAVEEEIKNCFGATFSLLDEEVISQEHPLRTVNDLVEYICMQLSKEKNGNSKKSAA